MITFIRNVAYTIDNDQVFTQDLLDKLYGVTGSLRTKEFFKECVMNHISLNSDFVCSHKDFLSWKEFFKYRQFCDELGVDYQVVSVIPSNLDVIRLNRDFLEFDDEDVLSNEELNKQLSVYYADNNKFKSRLGVKYNETEELLWES